MFPFKRRDRVYPCPLWILIHLVNRAGIKSVPCVVASTKDFIVPIPGTTKGDHLMDNLGADAVKFTAEELAQFRKELEAIEIAGLRLPEAILNFSEAK